VAYSHPNPVDKIYYTNILNKTILPNHTVS
jgi:hypothetical protein